MATGRPVMFLRTALTEQRIEALEKQVEWMMKFLKVPPEPAETDEEWEAAAPNKEPEDVPSELLPKQSKIAERIARGKK